MFKKVINLVAVLALITSMIPANTAEATSATLTASDVWHYSGYRVERLAFDGTRVVDLVSLGEHVAVATSATSCALQDCDLVNLYVLKDGGYVNIPNVPAEVVSEANYHASDDRLIWMDQTELDGSRYDIVEADLTTGEKNIILEDVFISGAESVSVVATDGVYYFNPTFNYNNHNGYKQAAVYKFDPATGDTVLVTKHYELNNEVVMDAADGKLLTKMTFESGYTQLWLYGDGLWPYAIPDTWTAPHEEIVGAHFLADGSIEFFRMYERYLWTPNEDSGVTEAQGEYLNWYMDVDEAFQIVGNNLAWLTPDRMIKISRAEGVATLGPIGSTEFYRLTEDKLFYDQEECNGYDQPSVCALVVNIDTVSGESKPFIVTDEVDNTEVGIMPDGSVLYRKDKTDSTLAEDAIVLGYGDAPYLSDESHAYWMGTDGEIYEATISPDYVGSTIAEVVKTADSNTVYLVDGENKYAFANEATYFTWFDSFDEVTTVTVAELSSYADAGDAPFAPGAKVKLVGDPKVYTVGNDGKLHWVISQAVAYLIYGSEWNQNIIDITNLDLVNYSFGSYIEDETDVNLI